MPQPLSLDQRQRATQAYLNGEGTQKEIAQRFAIALNFQIRPGPKADQWRRLWQFTDTNRFGDI